jgi:hypothetical protein
MRMRLRFGSGDGLDRAGVPAFGSCPALTFLVSSGSSSTTRASPQSLFRWRVPVVDEEDVMHAREVTQHLHAQIIPKIIRVQVGGLLF